MANTAIRVTENVAGDFFVDSTCIDCDTCRQLAPQVFREGPDHAFVWKQPESTADHRAALHAVVSCPTGSIGTLGNDSPKTVMADFPMIIEQPVYYCGFNSQKSFGGNSYFIQHPDGNWLVDSPKFLPHLRHQFDSLGGIANIFLTHQDDVADAEKYASHFGARRFIHRQELSSQPQAEVILDGFDDWELAPGLTAIPTPGHTSGHCALLLNNRFLFTGDHLYFDRHQQHLAAFRDYCWDSWARQIESMKRLTQHEFEWVLPGHGQRVHLDQHEMQRQLAALITQMQSN